MTDRELLEDAAKAAGIELDYTIRPDGMAFYHSGRNAFALANGGWFAPITDDGDALRLAVKLRINIEYLADMGGKSVGVNCWPRGRGDCGINEDDPDPLAATRRAIVRAAAEIGRR